MLKIKILKNEIINFEKDISGFESTYFNSFYMSKYEEHYSGISCSSLVVTNNDFIVAGFYFTDTEKNWSYFSRPIRVEVSEKVSSDDRFEIYQLILSFINSLFDKNEILSIKCEHDTFLFSEFCKYRTEINITYESIINLRLSEELIKRGMRKSYRSLINWGNREMTFLRIDKDSFELKFLEDFRLFHIEIAQKETRSKATWDTQWEMIKNGRGFLELGFYQNQLVAGALVLTGNKEAFYGVAVNNRTLMADKKPIGHAIMVRAIFEAKRLGLNIFNLGCVGPEFSNDKEYEIGKFKKGLSSEMRALMSFQFLKELE